MTFPRSPGPLAPVAAITSSTTAATASSSSCAGAYGRRISRSADSFSASSSRPAPPNASIASVRFLTSLAATSRTSSSSSSCPTSFSRFVIAAVSSRRVPTRSESPAFNAVVVSSRTWSRSGAATVDSSLVLPVLVAILALGAACVAWGIVVERSWYRVDRHRLAILPADAPGPVPVLHLSDLHFVRRDAKKTAFLAALPPADVTIVTGDFLAEPEAVEAAVAGVRPTRGSGASWFVLGSNDYYAPRPLNYLAYFRRSRK